LSVREKEYNIIHKLWSAAVEVRQRQASTL
jgi:hypothetical protein